MAPLCLIAVVFSIFGLVLRFWCAGLGWVSWFLGFGVFFGVLIWAGYGGFSVLAFVQGF